MALKGLAGPLGPRATSQPFSKAEEEGQGGPWPPWRLVQIQNRGQIRLGSFATSSAGCWHWGVAE